MGRFAPNERQRVKALEPFDPDKTYTAKELETHATAMLIHQRDKEHAEFTPLEREVLDFLGSIEKASTREIANALNANVGSIRNSLKTLARNDHVICVEERTALRDGRPVGMIQEKVWTGITTVEDAGPTWLNEDQILRRHQHEIQTAHGTPDPSIVSGIFNRAYREKRKRGTKEERETT